MAPATPAPDAPASFAVKAGLAQMLKGGVIMDVVDAEQARIAEEAGACAVMALERVPADIRKDGGVARMSDPAMIQEIMRTVTIPVMAKARIGHIVECQILQAIGVDYIDESEVLTPADPVHHVDKNKFNTPFVCGCRNLGEALRRISEGAAMIRTKGEAGTGDVVEAVRHMQTVNKEILRASSASDLELRQMARELEVDYALLKQTATLKRLPVVNFAAGGIATPADAALMMQMGCDGVFVGSGIFKSGDAAKRAKAIVQATTHYNDPKVLAEVSVGLGEAMVGINCGSMHEKDKLQQRGWSYLVVPNVLGRRLQPHAITLHLTLLATSNMFGFVADILTSVTSILFPVFASYKALRTSDPALLAPWLMYWTTLSLVLLIESQFNFILSWVPFYSWMRLGLHLYLVLPGNQGSVLIYQQYIHPFLEEHERQIDRMISDGHAKAKEAGLDIVQRGVEYIRVQILGGQPKQPTPPASRNVSYSTQLLNRFVMPSARDGLAPAGTSDVFNMISNVLQQRTHPDSSSRDARDANLASSGSLIPPTLAGDERKDFVNTQRERLRTLLQVFDAEAVDSPQGGAFASGRSASPQRPYGRRTHLNPSNEPPMSDSIHKSRSESEFEDLGYEGNAGSRAISRRVWG
nr:pyridoxal 5'-phosphate synthase subunit pdx1 [Quercus suber]